MSIHVKPNNTLARYNKRAPWLNWIEQPPPKGQVAGSNPAGVATLSQSFRSLKINPFTDFCTKSKMVIYAMEQLKDSTIEVKVP